MGGGGGAWTIQNQIQDYGSSRQYALGGSSRHYTSVPSTAARYLDTYRQAGLRLWLAGGSTGACLQGGRAAHGWMASNTSLGMRHSTGTHAARTQGQHA